MPSLEKWCGWKGHSEIDFMLHCIFCQCYLCADGKGEGQSLEEKGCRSAQVNLSVCVYSLHRGALSTDKAQGVKSLRTFLGSSLNMRVASKKHNVQLLKLFQHYLLIIILAGLDVFQPANWEVFLDHKRCSVFNDRCFVSANHCSLEYVSFGMQRQKTAEELSRADAKPSCAQPEQTAASMEGPWGNSKLSTTVPQPKWMTGIRHR